MASIFIYNYNNYYNRRVRGQNNTLSDYGTPIYIESGNAVNFNPADGVNTIFVAGKMSNSYTGKGDYFIYSEDNVSITSRWFILEADRTRNGQYKLQLRRDVIVDNFDAVMNGTALIEKGTVFDGNPLIYNSEPIPTNQIKTKEIELVDDTKSAWIVGYVARNASYTNTGSDKAQHPHRMTLTPSVTLADIEVSSLADWEFNKYVGSEVWKNIPNPDFETGMKAGSGNRRGYQNGSSRDTVLSSLPETRYSIRVINTFDNWLKSKYNSEIKSTVDLYKTLYFDRTVNLSDFNTLALLNGRILKAGDNMYKIHAKVETLTYKTLVIADKQGAYLRTYFTSLFSSASGVFSDTIQYADTVPIRLVYKANGIKLTLEPIVSDTYYIDFPENTERYNLKDAPYDMFAMRYADAGIITFGSIGAHITPTNKSLNIAIAQEVSRLLDAQCYDVQLVPYCPFTGYKMTDINMNVLDNSERRKTGVYNTKNELVSTLIWCTASTGTLNIILEEPLKIGNKKINNQCDMYRLVSPNFNGQFEFNLAKNGIENLQVFNVDFTYMPYNPYIHVNPQFDGLYGQDFNDARGLICGGDFSLARIGDAWRSYQLQNKNYQAIFDRQIQNMDVNRKYQRIEESVGAVAGSFQTSAQGFMVGGGVGAAVGGVLGLSAGLGDLALSEGKYKEQRSYAQDIHQYQLENVRALPYSLSKTTAFTFNNKIFPILEYYTCTDEEKLAVANEIANTGMTVGVIGQIQDYAFNTWSYKDIVSRNFVKCRLIRLEDIRDDTHLIDAISNELNKGVYFS